MTTQKTLPQKAKTIISGEPVITIVTTWIVALIALAQAFGLSISDAQSGALIAFAGATIALAAIVRRYVTPAGNACKCPPGTKRRRATSIRTKVAAKPSTTPARSRVWQKTAPAAKSSLPPAETGKQ